MYNITSQQWLHTILLIKINIMLFVVIHQLLFLYSMLFRFKATSAKRNFHRERKIHNEVMHLNVCPKSFISPT